MRRRRGAEGLAALREEARGLVAVAFYAARVGAGAEVARCRPRLAEVAELLGVEAPASCEEWSARPVLVDEWAARAGLSPWAGGRRV